MFCVDDEEGFDGADHDGVGDILLFIESVEHVEEVLDVGVAVVGHVVIPADSVAEGVGCDGGHFAQDFENALQSHVAVLV